ncbi:hypothetical protein [Prescottella equi]
MARQYPEITRGTAEYGEVTRILGPNACDVADGSVEQISNQWLKGDVFVLDADGIPILADDDGTLLTRRRRIRIPRTASSHEPEGTDPCTSSASTSPPSLPQSTKPAT